MKKNYWLIFGIMIATSVVAQVNTNDLPEIPAPAGAAATPVATETAAPETSTPAAPTAPAKKVAPKKKRAVKKINEPSVTLVPGPATVAAKQLNVRGQAGLRGEAVGQLKQGETVNVISQVNLDKHALDEPAQWAKISLPSGTKVWVSSHFVDATSKTVTARRLNLRAGPGENFSVLGTIERGTPVTEITSKGTWIEIQPPADAFAFVAAMYLDQTAIAAAQPATPVPTPETAPAPVPATSTTVAETQPVTTTPPPETMTPAPVANPPATAMTTEPEPIVVNTNPPPPRVATHEGYVRSSVSPVAPTAYELYDPATGNAINYLNSPTTNLDLSKYSGTQIIVTGEEGMTARWAATPVLTVQRIYVVNTNPPVPYQRTQSPRASQKTIRGTERYQRH